MRNLWRSIVIRDGFVVFADGTTHLKVPWGGGDANAGSLISTAGRRFGPGREGTIIYWPKVEPKDRAAYTTEMLRLALNDGWRSTPAGAKSGWFTFRKDGAGYVHLGIGPWMDQRKNPLFLHKESDRSIADRLARFHQMTGAAWRMTAGMTGCASIRAAYPTGEPLWRWDTAPADVIGCSWEMRWQRPTTAAEKHLRFVHHFDITGMYLAAALLTGLAHKAPVRVGPVPFDPRSSGYWLIEATPDMLGSDGKVPLVSPRVTDAAGRIWVTTSTMRLLGDVNIVPKVHDAWVSDSTKPILKRWAERLRDARYAVETDAFNLDLAAALKATSNRTVGTLARPGGRIYRPDWRDEVVDRARANFVRKIWGADGLAYPLRTNVDSVWYASDDERPNELYAALGAARYAIGKFRWVKTISMAEYQEAYQKDDPEGITTDDE